MTKSTTRDTPATYSPAESGHILHMLANGATDVECPRCSTDLTFGQAGTSSGTTQVLFEIRCEGCKRNIVLSDLPAQRSVDL